MRARTLVPAALGLAAVLLAVVLLRGGDDEGYRFKVHMANAKGLRTGSLITEGGVDIGKVEVDIGDDDQVDVTGTLKKGFGPIGAGAKAAITSVNLLGQKRLELDLGDKRRPLSDGATLPASRVTESTDLDQVLAVLNPDTRSRLNVLMNEAGGAVVGRHVDIAQLIDGLPATVGSATQLVDQVTGDNDRLSKLVAHSDQLVADLDDRTPAITRLVDSAGQAAESAASKRAELKATLHQAPGLLGAIQGFTGDLEQTTVPLGPAARDISAVAPQLSTTLDQLKPFRKAAKPTLRQAVDVAPDLTRLGTRATPPVKRLTPVVARLASFSGDLVPATNTLDKSVENLVGTIDNWSRAVQYRDGLSHIFRGEPTVTPQTLESLLLRLNPDGTDKKAKTKRGGDKTASAPDGKPDGAGDAPAKAGVDKAVDDAKGTVDKTVQGAKDTVDKTVKQAKDTVDGVTGSLPPLTGQPAPGAGKDQGDPNTGLLDFLLGA